VRRQRLHRSARRLGADNRFMRRHHARRVPHPGEPT
jgi:hypothetical protein